MKRNSMYSFLSLVVTLFITISAWAGSPCNKCGKHNKGFAETVIQTKSEFTKTLAAKNFPFTTKVFRYGDKAQKISVDIEGQQELVLITWGTADGNSWDHSVWANAKLITKSGEEVWLDKMAYKYGHAGWSTPRRNENSRGKPISIADKDYKHGMFCHAHGELVYVLDKRFKTFEAEVGIDNAGHKSMSSAVFKVQNISSRAAGQTIAKKFPMAVPAFLSLAHVDSNTWLTSNGYEVEKRAVANAIKKLDIKGHFQAEAKKVESAPADKRLKLYLELFQRINKVLNIQKEFKFFKPESIVLAVENMKKNPSYNAAKYSKMAKNIADNFESLKSKIYREDMEALNGLNQMFKDKKEILLANPLLDMDKLIVVRHKLGASARRVMAPGIGTQHNNWTTHMSARKRGFDCEIAELSNLRGEVKTKTIYKPENGAVVNSLKMHWDADKLMFTSVSKDDTWQIYEIGVDGSGFKRVTNSPEKDLNFFDGTYLPSGKIIAGSNIGYTGVPCVSGSDIVGSLCLYDPKDGDLRRLNFGQDNDWDPVVMNNGRIMYLRWEYTDNTHYFSRIIMHMNPDGTNKKELYGSGSYWPNSLFDAEPLPGKDNNQFVGIVTGHHGIARSGRMVTFDPKKGRHEEKGVMQEFPYRNRKVVPEIKDKLVDGVWPQFIKPQPLSKEYFLVTAKLTPNSLWGLYLIDVYDNITPIAEFEGEGVTEALPVVKKPTPPVIPEKVKRDDTESTIYIQDIYEGQGTKGVPRGTIKSVRVFAYEFAYVKSPSGHMHHGIQTGWDIKRILGTVPVEEDGSVMFKIPANLPVSLQPLDENGAAVQMMRSWLTGMPGEVVSCVGCHENQNTIAKPKFTIASRKQPKQLTAPEGGVRSFTFQGEIQPILDKRCIGCHDGVKSSLNFKDTSLDKVTKFGKSYLALHPFINRQGPEADIHVMKPMEYHVNTSELVQMLNKGHHNVELSDKERRTLYEWIDLNAPYRGVFGAKDYNGCDQISRRRELSKKYSNIDVDWVKELNKYIDELNNKGPVKTVMPKKLPPVKHKKVKARKWPFDADKAQKLQAKGGESTKTIEIAPGVKMTFKYIPAGSFVMGSTTGAQDEYPRAKVKIKKAFWMGEFEVTNEQYNVLVPEHDSRFTAQFWKDHLNPGYPSNKPEQPAIRVNWQEAMEFCKMLSQKTGLNINLPTEAQWEWAARSGSDNDFWFGSRNDDFSKYDNMADMQLADMAVTGVDPQPMSKDHPLRPYFDYIPRSKVVDDGNMLGVAGGKYKPNHWGLHDIYGNVAEWTRSDYAPYPYKAKDGRNDGDNTKNKVVRGGSWRDRTKISTSSARRSYKSWQKVFNVGFRVIIEDK